MILFSQTLIVSILAFVVAVQADTQQTLNSNELSLSNEQVTQYKYEKTIQSETIEKNQDNSITTSINTEIAQKTHSNNELDLNNVDDTDLNSALKVDVTAKLNGLESASNGNNPSDNGFAQSSKYYEHNVQNMEDLNGRTPTTPTSSPGSSGSPSSAAPTYPNGNLNSDSGTASDVYGMPSQPFMPLTYPMGVPSNINGGAPKNPQTPNPNSDNGSPKSNINGGTPTKPTSSLGSNGSPSNTSPNSPNGDLTGKLDSNGNLLTDNSYMKSYESYYYGYDAQNDVDQNGGSPTIPKSSPGSSGSPSSATPTYPNGNLNSDSGTASDVYGMPSQPFMPLTYPMGVPSNINGGVPKNPQTPNPNSDNGSPKSNINGGTPTKPTSSLGSNGSPSNTSPNSPNGDLTGKLDSNGNLLTDNSYMKSYESYYYGYDAQNDVDQNGGSPTIPKSSPGSSGSPSSAAPTYPNGNLNSDSGTASDVYGMPSQPFMPLTYPMGVPSNINGGAPKNPQTPNPNSDNGSPKSNINGGTPTKPTSSPDSNGSPSNTSPNPPHGDLTGKLDSNGNLLTDKSYMKSYESYYYGYDAQNDGDQNGGSPTIPKSSPGSSGSPSSAAPTYPNGNLNSDSGTASDVYGMPSQPFMPLTYPMGVPSNINGGAPKNPQTPNPNSDNGSPKSNINGGTPTKPTSSLGSNGSPSNTSPNSPNGDLTGKLDSNGNLLTDNSYMKSYESYYYGYDAQNDVDQNGGSPTIPKSSPGSSGSPSSAAPTYPNGNLNSDSGTASDVYGMPSQPFMPLTYPMGVPSNINGGAPKNPQTPNPNSDNGSPKSNINGGTPTKPTSSLGSNGSPSNTSPNPPNGDLTGKLDSNGNLLTDNSYMKSYESYYYGYDAQNDVDQNGGSPTIPKSSPGSSGSPSSAAPTYLNGNLNSDSGTASDVYGMPSQPFMPLTYPMGVPSNINGGVPNYPQTSNPNYDNGSPKSNINGGTPTKPTSSPGSNGSPSNTSPNSPNGDLTGKLDSNGNLLTDNSYMKSYESYYYGYDAQNDVDHNGGSPTIPTSSPGSNGSPSNISPNYPNGGLTDKPMEQFTDSYGNKLTVNSYQSPNENGFFQNIADQESSYPHLPEMSEGLNNQITQKSVSALNVQNTGTTDQFSFYPGIPSIMPNENSNDALSGGDLGWNSPTDINGSPQPVDQTPTVTEYSSMDSETYRFLKYDNMGYELQNTDVDEVLNDGQVNMDDRYMSDNFNDINNYGVNFPLLNKNGDVYNNFFYEKSSVNSARSSDGDYNIQNDGNNVDGYFENIGYDNGNLQVPSYDSYTPNLNAGYENSEPLRGNTFTGNVPYDNNIYPGNILYNYNNIDDIENDQTKTGIDELNPENNQLSRTDFNTFSNTQTSLTTDSYLDTDLSSDRMVYDFVDGDNIGTETIDSNYIGQVNENNVYDGQGFNGFNMKSTNVPEYNQLNKLNRDYATTYLGNSRTFEASSSNTGTNADIDSYDGPQLFNSEYNFPTSSDLHKQSSDLNEQSSDLNNLVIGNVQLEKYLYHTTDTSNVNTLVEGTNEDDSNGFLTNTEDNRLKSIQTAVLIKNNALDVGQNVYGANGQVIGKIYKPSNGTARTNNRHKYSGGSSYSSPSDSELSDDLHAIGHDVKQSAHGAISNVHDHIKDAYNTTKAVGKAVGSIVGNAVSDAVDDVQETAKNAYQGSKDAVKDVGNAVSGAVDDVQDTAKNVYQGSKDAVKDVGNAVNGAVDDVQETAKTAYQGLKNDVNAIENAVSDATDSVEKTAGYLY